MARTLKAAEESKRSTGIISSCSNVYVGSPNGRGFYSYGEMRAVAPPLDPASTCSSRPVYPLIESVMGCCWTLFKVDSTSLSRPITQSFLMDFWAESSYAILPFVDPYRDRQDGESAVYDEVGIPSAVLVPAIGAEEANSTQSTRGRLRRFETLSCYPCFCPRGISIAISINRCFVLVQLYPPPLPKLNQIQLWVMLQPELGLT